MRVYVGGVLCVIVLILIWCILSGQGALVNQAGDWTKHNVILNDLIKNKWPVHYTYRDMDGVLSYYIAEYLIPALAGKLGGLTMAEITLFLQVFLGVFLTWDGIARYVGSKGNSQIILIAVILILFSTFITPFTLLYGKIWLSDMGDGLHWMSSSVQIQYSSNIILLKWFFPQCVPIWLTSILLIQERDHVEQWGLIFVPAILYSTFAFVGIAALLMMFVISDLISQSDKKDYLRRLLCKNNVLVLLVAGVLAGYIAGNVLQPKPELAQMKLELINYWHRKTLFLLFESAWGKG